ncbi:LytTR family DNA-binding domain-containing protein [Burkholderiaceae bacterium DAT-1]|nr:LytTR family DNA-binding domain-containing protein [Burkholderiaceae bacterium DAT-1]
MNELQSPTAILADDEPNLLEHLRQTLSRMWPELKILACCKNGLEARAALGEYQPDIAFLDIQMPGLSGLDVAASVGDVHYVFITAYDEFAVQAFEQDAVDYILKPVAEERLARSITKLKDQLASHAPRTNQQLIAQLKQALGHAAPLLSSPKLSWIRASIGQDIHMVAVEDVCYFQSTDKYTSVITADSEYLIRTPLKELMEQLDPDFFWQVHRSTVINVREIREAKRDATGKVTLFLRSRAEKIAVSRAYSHLFRQM